jgi:hypothetical protein
MGVMQAGCVRARSTPLDVTPGTASGLVVNSPPSMTPSTTAVTSEVVTATGGTGSYAWTRISGSTAINANAPSAASTDFTSTTVPVDGSQSAVFRCTSGSETVDVPVDLSYESGL